jgi:hypothetical protein
MSLPPDTASPIGRRYGTAAALEWQRVQAHFALHEGFGLLVLLVPDSDGASLCRQALADQLADVGGTLLDLSPDSPSKLRVLAETLLQQDPPPGCGAIWIAAAVPEPAPDHAAWMLAWRWALATVNQNRNRAQARFRCTLVMVGAPWLVPLFREAAPDLWSVRSVVARIEPEPARLRQDRREALPPDEDRRRARRSGAGPGTSPGRRGTASRRCRPGS